MILLPCSENAKNKEMINLNGKRKKSNQNKMNIWCYHLQDGSFIYLLLFLFLFFFHDIKFFYIDGTNVVALSLSPFLTHIKHQKTIQDS